MGGARDAIDGEI
ncbi:hypothetical protein Tco_0028650, partial [Tanacetum coccineum]